MMIKKDNTYYKILLALFGVFALTACSSDGDDVIEQKQDGSAITFDAGQNEGSVASRANASLSTVAANFRVWGEKKLDSSLKSVFVGDWVNYVAAAATEDNYDSDHSLYNGWSYLSGTNTSDQTLRFWDTETTEYHFMAGAPASNVTGPTDMATGTKAITLGGLKMGASDASSDTHSDAFYADPVTVATANYGKPVTLTFNHYLSKIHLLFYFSDLQIDEQTLADVTFKPVATDGSYITDGTATVTYDFSKSTPTTTYTTNSSATTTDALEFGDVVIPSLSTAQKEASRYYYILPQSQGAWQVSFTQGAITKTASVPAEYMSWKPGYDYYYAFKISLTSVTFDNTLFVYTKWQTGYSDTTNW